MQQLDPLRFLARVVPLRAIPVEMFGELVYSAHLFGVLACRVALDLLAGRPVRHRIASTCTR